MVEELLIKVSQSDESYLPIELAAVKDALHMAINAFHEACPSAKNEFYCYATTSCGIIPENCHQRFQSIHSYGLMGHKHLTLEGDCNLKSITVFCVSNLLPTEFFVEAVDIQSLDLLSCDAAKYFDKTVASCPHVPQPL